MEAGIAGRGLRQGLAELAESLGDNTAAFKKLGISVEDEQGNMLLLTEIAANFAETLEAGVINDTELLTTLIEDLNVRGATAFVHLVQSSDEFTQAVKDLENAGGELDEMVRIQNESLGAQLQILRNNVQAIFLLRDAEYESELYMNRFHEAVAGLVEQFQALLVVEEDGTYILTEFGRQLQEIAISGVELFLDLAKQLVTIIKEFTTEGKLNLDILKLYTVPLKIIMDAFSALGPNMQRFVIYLHMMNKLVPLQAIAMTAYAVSYALVNAAQIKEALLAAAGLPRKLLGIAYSWLFAGALTAEAKARTYNVSAALQQHYVSKMSYRQQLKAILLYPLRLAFLGAQWVWNKLITKSIWSNIKAVAAATISWSLFWIVATGGIILLVAALVAGFYQINKEFNVLGAIFDWLNDAFKRFGEAFKPLWDDVIYPFVWRFGMELYALGGIIYLTGAAIAESLSGPLETAAGWALKIWDNIVGFIGAINEFVTEGTVAGMTPVEWTIWGFNEILITIIKAHNAWKVWVAEQNAEAAASKAGEGAPRWGWGYGPKKGFITDNIPNLLPGIVPGKVQVAAGKYGANIQAMASGGNLQGSALVGEAGPELFTPRESGQVINSRRTQEILQDIRRRGQVAGAGNTIVVDTLIAQNTINRSTRMSIDAFAGVV